MQVKSAQFVKGVVGPDPIFGDGKPQIALIGRSNVGKSSLINSLTGQSGLARTSSAPGRTRQINVFLVNGDRYLVDLPGYGYARVSHGDKRRLFELIDWYLFGLKPAQRQVVLIVDAKIGPTRDDLEVAEALEAHQVDFLVVANKADALKPAEAARRLREIGAALEGHEVIPYSAARGTGRNELWTRLQKPRTG